MEYDRLEKDAEQRALNVLGGFHPDEPSEHLPTGTQTVILLGPDPDHFWHVLQDSPERDVDDPVDRWSSRVIGGWAAEIGATALFPFGTPHLPFISWALASGRCHLSPVNLLVHDTAGLMVSFRGALAVANHITLPAAPPAPCLSCATQPCRAACPIGVLTPDGYDVPGCRDHLRSAPPCLTEGCAVRRSCPASHKRPAAQSEHHMRAFMQ